MFRMLRDLFGGGIFGLFFAMMVMMMLLVIVIASIAVVIIVPVFFLALILCSAFSSWFMKKVAKRVIDVEIGEQSTFSITMNDFLGAFQFRASDVYEALQESSAKERQADDKLIKVQRGLESLRETYNKLLSEHTVKEHFYSRPKITSERIKNAAMTTFDEPSFTKTIADIENERVRFEEFLI